MHPLFALHRRLFREPGVNVAGSQLAVLNRGYRHRFAGQLGGVAACEHPRVARPHLPVSQRVTAFGFDAELLQGGGEFLLTDRLDHLVTLDNVVAAGDLADAAAAVLVRFGHFGADALEPRHPAVFAQHPYRLAEEAELHAFVLHERVLEVVSRHLPVGAAVHDGDPFRAEAPGDGGGVDGGVARPDHGHVAAQRDVAQVLESVHLRQFAGSDERQRLGDAFEFLAGDVHVRHPAHADPQEHGVELIQDLLRVDVNSDFDASLDLYTQAADEFDFLEADPDRFTHDDDAVGGQATRQFVLLEHSHVVTFERQLA